MGAAAGTTKKPRARAAPKGTASAAPRGPERPLLTVDAVVLALRDEALSVLVIERGVEPFAGREALPGGFVLAGEPVEAAALRELREETGLEAPYIEQLYTFADPARDPRGRVVSIAHLALLPSDRAAEVTVCGGTDARDARWLDAGAVLAAHEAGGPARLAFDHDAIVAMAVARLRGKLEYTTLAFELLPREFTLSEAQRAYEAVLGRALDKVTFRRRMEALGLLRETPRVRTGPHRPARLYTAAPRATVFL